MASDPEVSSAGGREPETPRAEKRMSFFEHLAELRRRMSYGTIALALGFLLCYPFRRELFHVLEQPILAALPPGGALAYTRLTEPFLVYLKVAALGGLFVASPFVFFQAWLFVAPALYRNERRYALAFLLPATLFFLAGGAFAFYLLLPGMCRFFVQQGQDFQMVVTVNDYFSLLFWTVLGVALTFELPVFIGLLARFGLVRAGTLLKRLDVAFVASLIVSALITPTPDPLNMIIVALPMMALYLLGIGVARLVAPRPAGEEPR